MAIGYSAIAIAIGGLQFQRTPWGVEKRGGGEEGSDRLLAAPPGQRSRDPEMICRMAFALVFSLSLYFASDLLAGYSR